MTLLPREQHVLNEIARSLMRSDPALAARLSGRVRLSRRDLPLVVGIFLIAPSLMVAGIVSHNLPMLDAGIVLAALTPVLVSAVMHLRRSRKSRGRYALDEP
jgi:hypothetical protein